MGQPDVGTPGPIARARRWLRMIAAPESALGKRVALLALLLLTGLCLVLDITLSAATFPALTLVVPIVFGGLLLEPRPLVVEFAAVLGVLIAENLGVGHSQVHLGAYVVVVIVAGIAFQQSLDRQRLGLSLGRGEQMLFELRDRLRSQGELPPMPATWHAEVEQHSAGGASFGGDFLVATLADGGRSMELVLVDVSGKGVDAGTRALMLSGALGGLLGAVPPPRFLPSANEYLLRQGWGEGFATALHLTVELTTGRYRLSTAGHPPAVHYVGGTGKWQVVEPQGTVLGLLPDAEFGFVEGELRPYDALLLYTDGLVEVPGRDLAVGIDKLLGAAERLIPRGFDGGAQRLMQEAAPNASDDRAIVLLWRT
ncbi:MAG TPA: PP2C family protein-serine/threonine phosphatase [Mycobacteriales bacterium]|nr:PP2C family protein-serine/threonine phosphatase [Mycobacteriales bacterium]